MALVEPLERMLQAPAEALSAFEPQLDDDDPWVRALARLQTGKMRIMFGHGGLDADEHLETALAEFQAIGERFGISLALTELADRIAVRGEFARAARATTSRRSRSSPRSAPPRRSSGCGRGRRRCSGWPGTGTRSAAAIADGERSAERVTWPDALAELALAKVDLARWSGDPAESRRQIDVATALLGEEAEQPYYPRDAHDMLAPGTTTWTRPASTARQPGGGDRGRDSRR